MTRSLAPTLSVTEAAEIIGISRGTAYELIREDNFPVAVLRLGRLIRVPTAALLRVLGIRDGALDIDESAVQLESPQQKGLKTNGSGVEGS